MPLLRGRMVLMICHRAARSVASVLLLNVLLSVAAAAAEPRFGPAEIRLGDSPVPASFAVCGLRVAARDTGPQVAIMGGEAVFSLQQGEEAAVAVAAQDLPKDFRLAAETAMIEGAAADVSLSADDSPRWQAVQPGAAMRLEAAGTSQASAGRITLRVRATTSPAAVRCGRLRLAVDAREVEVPLRPADPAIGKGPPPVLPPLRSGIEQALIEWDWRMQDGIGTERVPSTYAAAIERTLRRGDQLLTDLEAAGVSLDREKADWQQARRAGRRCRWWPETAECRTDCQSVLRAVSSRRDGQNLWRQVHAAAAPHRAGAIRWRRSGRWSSSSRCRAMFSHQLTQYYGKLCPAGRRRVRAGRARPSRCSAANWPPARCPLGSYQHLDVSCDGQPDPVRLLPRRHDARAIARSTSIGSTTCTRCRPTAPACGS